MQNFSVVVLLMFLGVIFSIRWVRRQRWVSTYATVRSGKNKSTVIFYWPVKPVWASAYDFILEYTVNGKTFNKSITSTYVLPQKIKLYYNPSNPSSVIRYRIFDCLISIVFICSSIVFYLYS